MRSEGSIYEQIRETGELSDDIAQKLDAEIEKFKHSFNVREESALV
jgi:F0F1-type ATP synthase alpha subunit